MNLHLYLSCSRFPISKLTSNLWRALVPGCVVKTNPKRQKSDKTEWHSWQTFPFVSGRSQPLGDSTAKKLWTKSCHRRVHSEASAWGGQRDGEWRKTSWRKDVLKKCQVLFWTIEITGVYGFLILALWTRWKLSQGTDLCLWAGYYILHNGKKNWEQWRTLTIWNSKKVDQFPLF